MQPTSELAFKLGERGTNTVFLAIAKPLSGSHLRERVEESVKRNKAKEERGDTDITAATRDDLVFHLTELVDARL